MTVTYRGSCTMQAVNPTEVLMINIESITGKSWMQVAEEVSLPGDDHWDNVWLAVCAECSWNG